MSALIGREEVSARLTGFLHVGEATSPLEPQRRRHLNRVLGFRKFDGLSIFGHSVC